MRAEVPMVRIHSGLAKKQGAGSSAGDPGFLPQEYTDRILVVARIVVSRG
jgi:hypothetical protein